MTYKYADESGNEVRIEPSIIRESCRVITQDLDLEESACVVIPRENVPSVAAGIAAAMHCSVDLQAPIILSPPKTADGAVIDGTSGVAVHRSYDLARPVILAIRGVTDHLAPDAAREVAAQLALTANEADADPDRTTSAYLAELICAYGGAEDGHRLARAILSRYRLEERDA
jgi:hypothetical protein